MRQRDIIAGVALAVLGVIAPAAAQAPPTNPSTASWTAPTTNTDGSALTDLASYRLRVAGPSATAPAYSTASYPVKATVASSVPNPAANTTVTFGTGGSTNLVGDLGLTADGQYWLVVTAVDLANNESAPSPAIPFVRNRVAPSAPSGVQSDP